MSWLDRMRERIGAPVRRTARAVSRLQGDEQARMTLQLPSPHGTRPWLEVACELQFRETEHGEELHLRTQLRADFARLLRHMPEAVGDDSTRARLTQAPATDGSAASSRADSPGRALQERMRDGMRNALVQATRRGLQLPAVRRALAPLADQRVESWMEILGSSAPLDRRAGAMLPEALQRLGVEPDPNGPPIQSWEGDVPGGSLHVTTIQLDERHIDQKDARGRPMRIAATFAQLNEHAPASRED